MITELGSAIAQDLLADAVGMVVISVAIVGLFVGTELASRWFTLQTEWTRKVTHLGSGAVVLSFPWLVSSAWTVGVLAISFASILIGGRLTGLLGSIHNVERRTGGAYYYPFAVLGVWLLSDGDALLFCVPLAIMAVADTGAALVGKHAGQTRYQVMDGSRTLEGSMAFFGLAFAIVLIGAALAGRPGWPAALLVTLVVAALTTSVEAVSVRGSDNLGIPYAAWLALEHTERLGLDALGDWVMGMTLGVVIVFVSARRARLDAAGGVVVFLVSTMAFALGGLLWFVPIGAVYLIYLVGRLPDMASLDRVFPTTAGAMIIVLLLAHTGRQDLFIAYLTAVAASGAMGGMLIATVRRWPRVLMAPVGAFVPVIAANAMDLNAPFVGPLLGALFATGALWVLRGSRPVGRRVLISLAAGLGVWWITLFTG